MRHKGESMDRFMMASLPSQLLWHKGESALLDIATEQKTRSSRIFYFGDFSVHQKEAVHSHFQVVLSRDTGLIVNELSVAMRNRTQWRQHVSQISRAIEG